MVSRVYLHKAVFIMGELWRRPSLARKFYFRAGARAGSSKSSLYNIWL